MRAASLLLLILAFFFLRPLGAFAQTSLAPFQTQVDLGFMGLFGSMQYRLNGQTVDHYRDFKKIIYPLKDAEASRWIREAEQTDFISWVTLSAGLATSLDIALVYQPVVVFNVNWEDRAMTFLLTGQIGLGIWALIHNAAENRKFNAVQRYNHVILKGMQESALELSPALYANKDSLLLGEKLSF